MANVGYTHLLNHGGHGVKSPADTLSGVTGSYAVCITSRPRGPYILGVPEAMVLRSTVRLLRRGVLCNRWPQRGHLSSLHTRCWPRKGRGTPPAEVDYAVGEAVGSE